MHPPHTAHAANCSSILSGWWDEPSTWDCNVVPGNTDIVTINPGHNVAMIDDHVALALHNYGKLDIRSEHLILLGSYYSESSSSNIVGDGTIMFHGLSGTDLCAGTFQADFNIATVNFSPVDAGNLSCTNGMVASKLIMGNGTLSLFDDSTFIDGIEVHAGGILDTGVTHSTCNGTITNNGRIRATRASPGASSTSFGLAGGTGSAFVVQPLTGGFSSLALEWHGANHPNKTGAGVSSGVGWGEHWDLSVTGSDNVLVTVPTLFTPGSNSKVCYHVSDTTWNCAQTSYNAVSTSKTVTRNPVSITTNLTFAVGGNVGPTSVVVNNLSASSRPIIPTGFMGLALVGLLSLGFGGYWLTRRVLKFKEIRQRK